MDNRNKVSNISKVNKKQGYDEVIKAYNERKSQLAKQGFENDLGVDGSGITVMSTIDGSDSGFISQCVSASDPGMTGVDSGSGQIDMSIVRAITKSKVQPTKKGMSHCDMLFILLCIIFVYACLQSNKKVCMYTLIALVITYFLLKKNSCK